MRYISKDTKKQIVIAIIIGTIGGLTAIGMFSLSGLMLSKSAYKVPLYTLMTLVATIKLFGVVRAICKYFERLISHEATFEMLKDIRVTIVHQLLNNFLSIQSKYNLSTLLNRTVNDIEKLQNLLLRVIYPPLIALITTIIVVMIYAQFSIYAVITLFISMVLMTVVLPLICSKYLFSIVRSKIETTTRYEQKLLDYHLSREALRVFDKENVYMHQLTQLQRKMERAIKKENFIIIIYDFLLNLIAMISIFIVIYVMIYDPAMDVLMYLSMVMVTITLFEMSIPMIHFPYHKSETGQSIQHLDELNQSEHYESYSQPIESIQLKDVSIDNRLKKINLSINQGDIIGIAGPSGAGKSTLLRAILGLEYIGGQYSINGATVQTPLYLLDHFCVMEQSNHFIEGTIKENMLVEVDDDTLNGLLRQFNLPFTSESMVHSFGENLSGGERKRLHFIRMILREQLLWILDEPFNGVDQFNQQIMMDYLKQLKHHTILIVSHDLSVFDIADYIYFLENGEIKEQGSYEEMMNKRTRFSTLKEKQLLSI